MAINATSPMNSADANDNLLPTNLLAAIRQGEPDLPLISTINRNQYVN